MVMITQIVGAFIAIVALSYVMLVPKKFIIYSGIAGAFGWFIYLILEKLDFQIVFRYFCAAIFVALISHSFARLFKAPVTVFLITGIVPLVPGVGMYRIAFYFISGETISAAYYLTQTIEIAGVIALAIFIMDSIFRIFQEKISCNFTRK